MKMFDHEDQSSSFHQILSTWNDVLNCFFLKVTEDRFLELREQERRTKDENASFYSQLQQVRTSKFNLRGGYRGRVQGRTPLRGPDGIDIHASEEVRATALSACSGIKKWDNIL
jgi:hypothetical protein